MYSNIKGVQILVSLLKQHDIRHIVISPGARNTPLAFSVESDDFFCCYSMIDERSAGYFALGIAEALDVPVCVSCTSATATSNYLPAVKEAFERNLQLIALTGDRDLYSMFHMQDQCVNQVDMYHGFVKFAVDVPMLGSSKDYWYCNRCINEALLALNHHGKGPVQINYHLLCTLNELSMGVENLPVTRKINRYENIDNWAEFAEQLRKKQRILIICGSDYIGDDTLKKAMQQFTDKYNCVALCDTYSNAMSDDAVRMLKSSVLGEILGTQEKGRLAPDLILSFGNVYYSVIKEILSGYARHVEHWEVAVDGVLSDGFHCLTKVFECRPEVFFTKMSENATGKNNDVYFALWQKRLSQLRYPEKFSNFKAIKQFCCRIPSNSILHTTVLNSIRISNYVDYDPSVRCFANIGADGIDGALSTFLGQAESDEHLAFLLIGDLSLIYDMNALLLKMSKNVRILVINNHAGAEFYKNFGLERIPSLDRHIAARHNVKFEQCHMLSNLEYLSAADSDELEKVLDVFLQEGDRAMLLEVFTDADTDAKTLKEYWRLNRGFDVRACAEQLLRTIIGEKNWSRLRQTIKKIYYSNFARNFRP